jgi:homoserine O-acetyltransferase
MLKKYIHNEPFKTELGDTIQPLEIAYHTYGTLNEQKDNVVWICHALTANSDAADWWNGMVGEGKFFDPGQYFIVCANIIGSHYGTTGPLSKDTDGKTYYRRFPDVTIRDMVRAHILLRKHLNIEKIKMLTGGSIGSFQALEWAIMEPELIEYLILIAGGAKATSWTTAFNEAQRMAIRADSTFFEDTPEGGIEGMKAARAMALISYRNAQTYNATQPLSENDDFRTLKAITYQQYQGEKLAKRFNAYSYYVISRAFDSHHPGRNRGGLDKALQKIKARTLVVGIDSDLLFPNEEQYLLQDKIPGAQLKWLTSKYGHDGFLLEFEQLEKILKEFMETNSQSS